MAVTTKSQLWDPEVWADLAQAEFVNKAVVATSPATTSDDTLTGVPGSTIKFPKWNTLTDLDDLTEATAMTPVTLSQTSSEATIKEAGKAVEISDTADLVGLGDPQSEAIRQFGVLAARKVDADLITVAGATVSGGTKNANGSAATNSAPLSFDTAAGVGLTWASLVDAIEKFGDDFEPSEFAGIFIRSNQRSQIWKDDDFIKASELSAAGSSSVVGRGLIGQIGGLNVYVTDRLATNKALIVKNGALGLLYKRRPIVEQDRDILKRTSIVTTNLHYATKRLNDKGVCVVTFTPGP